MRIVKRVLIILLALLSLATTLILAGVLWIVLEPLSAWHFAEKHFLPADLKVEWQEMDFNLKRGEGLSFEISWHTANLKLKKEAPSVTAEFDKIDLAILVLLSPRPSFKIHDFALQARKPLVYHAGPAVEPVKEQNLFDQIQIAFDYLKQARQMTVVERVDINIDEIQAFTSSPKPILAGVHLLKTDPQKPTVEFTASAQELSAMVHELRLQGRAELDRFESVEPFLEAKLTLKGPKLSLNLPLMAIYGNGELQFNSKPEVRFKSGKQWLTAKPVIHGQINAKEVAVALTTSVDGIPGPLVRVRKLEARFHLPLTPGQEWSASPSTFHVRAPLALFFIDKNMQKPIEKSCQCRVPEELRAELKGQAWLKNFMEPNKARLPLLEAAFSLESVSNKLFSADVGATLKIFNDKKVWLYEPAVDSQIVVHSFQGLRQFLDAKNILIPAPLSALDGTMTFTARGPIAMKVVDKNTQFTLASAFKVDLSSKNQKVDLTTDMKFTAALDLRRADVDVNLKIQKLRLEMPPFDPIYGIPKAGRDARIQMQPPQPPNPKGFKLYVHLNAATAAPGSIQLLSKLAEPLIPVTLELHRPTADAMQGSIRLEPFKVNYLHRILFVDAFRLDLAELDDGEFPIAGDFHIEQTDYKVMIHVGGTTKVPQINLSSDPYLERADIISVLLYDRTNDQLVSGDAETVGGVQAAMADRAIGLFGLWAFATTPIRSFSYNAVTKVYTATVALGGGATAGVGTSWDQNASLEVRKRVSKRWVLTASWAPSEDQHEVGKVVLQWEKRF